MIILSRIRSIAPALFAWSAVWLFWLVATWGFHPTPALAVVVTTSLVGAYAAVFHLNRGVLVPRLWKRGRKWGYLGAGVAMMGVGNGVALGVIRGAYGALWGSDADPDGAVKHFAIDLFGMAVHLVGATAVAWGWRGLVGGRRGA